MTGILTVKYDHDIEVLQILGSIAESVQWLEDNQTKVGLIFMDIQLTDGLSFEIFDRLAIKKPVIFTTAFDEYAIDAFKVNSVDYLLKPITFTDLSNAIKKFSSLKQQFSEPPNLVAVANKMANALYKDRFLVRLGNHIHSIKTGDIALFYANGRTVYLVTNEGRKFILDYKLEDLCDLLNPKTFYRCNRTFVVNINAISDVIVYSNSRLKIDVDQQLEKEIIVSREKVSGFKKWLEGE